MEIQDRKPAKYPKCPKYIYKKIGKGVDVQEIKFVGSILW